jgi:hypothetical protein
MLGLYAFISEFAAQVSLMDGFRGRAPGGPAAHLVYDWKTVASQA